MNQYKGFFLIPPLVSSPLPVQARFHSVFIASGRTVVGQGSLAGAGFLFRKPDLCGRVGEVPWVGWGIVGNLGDKENMSISEGVCPTSTEKRFFLLPSYPQTGKGPEGWIQPREERGREVTVRTEVSRTERLLFTQLQRQGLGAQGLQRIGSGWGSGGPATFCLGLRFGRLWEPRWVVPEQEISQGGPQRAWLKILCLVLAQKLYNVSGSPRAAENWEWMRIRRILISKTEKCIPQRATRIGISGYRQVTKQMAWDTFCPTPVAQAPGNYLLSPLTSMTLALSNLSWTAKLPQTKWRWFAMDWECIFLSSWMGEGTNKNWVVDTFVILTCLNWWNKIHRHHTTICSFLVYILLYMVWVPQTGLIMVPQVLLSLLFAWSSIRCGACPQD